MRATPSKDGVPRATVHIAHRISARQLIAACILDLPHGEDLTRADIEQALRDCLRRGGSEIFHGWDDGLDPKTSQRLLTWAVANVRRYWPDLFLPTTPHTEVDTHRQIGQN